MTAQKGSDNECDGCLKQRLSSHRQKAINQERVSDPGWRRCCSAVSPLKACSWAFALLLSNLVLPTESSQHRMGRE